MPMGQVIYIALRELASLVNFSRISAFSNAGEVGKLATDMADGWNLSQGPCAVRKLNGKKADVEKVYSERQSWGVALGLPAPVKLGDLTIQVPVAMAIEAHIKDMTPKYEIGYGHRRNLAMIISAYAKRMAGKPAEDVKVPCWVFEGSDEEWVKLCIEENTLKRKGQRTLTGLDKLAAVTQLIKLGYSIKQVERTLGISYGDAQKWHPLGRINLQSKGKLQEIATEALLKSLDKEKLRPLAEGNAVTPENVKELVEATLVVNGNDPKILPKKEIEAALKTANDVLGKDHSMTLALDAILKGDKAGLFNAINGSK